MVKIKKQTGITLVALIITIIVMLILVGVSVQVLIDSDLIGTAQNAGSETEQAYEAEGSNSEIKVNGKTYGNATIETVKEIIEEYSNMED